MAVYDPTRGGHVTYIGVVPTAKMAVPLTRDAMAAPFLGARRRVPVAPSPDMAEGLGTRRRPRQTVGRLGTLVPTFLVVGTLVHIFATTSNAACHSA